jgi:molybdopterin-containing oxidoreductase family membrane subunit
VIENALRGSRKYWVWIALLLVLCVTGFLFYLRQWDYGLGITGMSRDVSWGLYIANFTFMVGVAASAVMVVLPYYLHNYKEFGKITVLGEFLAVAAVLMAVLFVLVDLGQISRAFNIILYPSPRSLLFWDLIVLSGYFLLNIIIAWSTLDAEWKSEPPLGWVRPIIILSVIRKLTGFDPGKVALQKVAQIVTYAMIANVFLLLVELFTVFYSGVPEHLRHFQYLLFGIEGQGALVPWMWTSIVLAAVALILLINPATRRKEVVLAVACAAVFASVWIDKGLGLIATGFIPSPTGTIFEYLPTVPEIFITLGVWALGFLILTVLYKVAVSVKGETPG